MTGLLEGGVLVFSSYVNELPMYLWEPGCLPTDPSEVLGTLTPDTSPTWNQGLQQKRRRWVEDDGLVSAKGLLFTRHHASALSRLIISNLDTVCSIIRSSSWWEKLLNTRRNHKVAKLRGTCLSARFPMWRFSFSTCVLPLVRLCPKPSYLLRCCWGISQHVAQDAWSPAWDSAVEPRSWLTPEVRSRLSSPGCPLNHP